MSTAIYFCVPNLYTDEGGISQKNVHKLVFLRPLFDNREGFDIEIIL
jgi:hypothetical protein